MALRALCRTLLTTSATTSTTILGTARGPVTRFIPNITCYHSNNTRSCSTATSSIMSQVEDSLSSLEEKSEQSDDTAVVEDHEDLFAELLYNSPLMQLDSFKGKIVVGKVMDVVNRDLYIDYGGKFNVVATLPDNMSQAGYEKGSLVRVELKDYEVIGKFMGDDKYLTICESDGLLIGPVGGGGKMIDRLQKKKKKNPKWKKTNNMKVFAPRGMSKESS